MRMLSPRELELDMILAEPVKTPIGQILAEPGDKVSRQLINRMKLYKVKYASVIGEEPNTGMAALPPDIAEKAAETPPTPPAPPKTDKNVAKRRAEAAKFQGFEMQYFLSIEKMKVVFKEAIEQKSSIDTADLLNTVSDLFLSRDTIIELFELLYKMHTLNDSVYAHSLNVALIARMIGRWLKLDRQDLNVLTIAGLLHDIGKLMIPEEILNKPGKLTDEEFAMIKSHPQKGYDILKDLPLDDRIKKAALMHHERADGSGYPSGLSGDSIDKMAEIIAIADVYDAMTAARSYRSPLCPFQVISNFEKDGFQKYNTKYILTFLKRIATTYQNSRVVLNDGRGCKIVMLNQNRLSKPVVQFLDGSCLDLSTEKDLYIHKVIS